jgi:hypothetical protein
MSDQDILNKLNKLERENQRLSNLIKNNNENLKFSISNLAVNFLFPLFVFFLFQLSGFFPYFDSFNKDTLFTYSIFISLVLFAPFIIDNIKMSVRKIFKIFLTR